MHAKFFSEKINNCLLWILYKLNQSICCYLYLPKFLSSYLVNNSLYWFKLSSLSSCLQEKRKTLRTLICNVEVSSFLVSVEGCIHMSVLRSFKWQAFRNDKSNSNDFSTYFGSLGRCFCKSLSRTFFLSSSIIFFLSHAPKLTRFKASCIRPSLISLSRRESVEKLGDKFTWKKNHSH